MTYRYAQTSYYANTNPLIQYGDSWLYGEVLPTTLTVVPTNIYVLHEKDYNIISWTNPSNTDMKGYYVYRSKTLGHQDIETIAYITKKDSENKTQTCYIDYLTDTELNTQYYYAVAAVSHSGYASLLSDWSADINLDQSYHQYKYLYTNQMTQSYWNTLDLYKKLGNFDVDRNVIPFRDLGYNYIDNNGTRIAQQKNCNYLYATLLDPNIYTYNNLNNYTFALYIDGNEVSKNKPNWLTSAHIYTIDTAKSISNLSIDKDTFFKKVDTFILGEVDPNEDTFTFKYTSSYMITNGTLKSFILDRDIYFNKFLTDNTPSLPPSVVEFIYNGVNWTLNNVNINLVDYGITYSTRSILEGGLKITITEKWEIEELPTAVVNAVYDTLYNNITLYDNTNPRISFGVTYNNVILQNTTKFKVDYNRQAFVYLRVPKIYNSKALQVVLRENGVTGNQVNTHVFKAYNYLIFPSVFGKIFNQKHLELKKLKGDLYKSDVSNDAIYKNFGSYFEFEQPAWMQETTYRACVLGSDTVAGLLKAGIDGGTLKGLKEVIQSVTLNTTNISKEDKNYLTIYSNIYSTIFSSLSDLPIIKAYSTSSVYTQNDVIAYTSEQAVEPVMYNLNVTSNITDTTICLRGNGIQSNNSIGILQGSTAIHASTSAAAYTIFDCALQEEITVKNTIDYSYLVYVGDSSTSFITLNYFQDDTPTSPAVNEYWYKTSLHKLYKYTTTWTEVTSNIPLIYSNIKYYYYILNNVSGLYQIIQMEDTTSDNNYYINMSRYFKDILFAVTSSDDRVALYTLNGRFYKFVKYDVQGTKTNWIFKDNYSVAASTDPYSYTHNYIVNTWDVSIATWLKTITMEKYVVYGSTIKINNDNIYPTGFTVQHYTDGTVYQQNIDYTIDTATGYLTWISDAKPADGEYVGMSYIVDIRKELIRLIDLIKMPQVHINYIWTI